MSLVGTLAKVAIGVVIAKGVGSMIQKGRAPGGPSGGAVPDAGGGSVFGGPYSPGGTGLEDMMGEVLGGGRAAGTNRTAGGRTTPAPDAGVGPATGGDSGLGGGGLGGFLEELAGAGRSGRAAPGGGAAPQGGGLDDLLGQLGGALGGGTAGPAGGGSLGDLLGGLLGGLAGGMAGGMAGGGATGGAVPGKPDAPFGEVLNQSLRNRGEPSVAPTAGQDAAAALMLRAMIMAAKCDGRIDETERQKLLGNLGDVSAAERRFVETELAAPIDVAGLARQVPRGLEPQVYTMSVMAIDLDSQAEARYLDALAQALGIGRDQVNHIHARLGLPALYG
ncbi:MAG: tellurite resistance TerB family protein [Pseudomonadota bacterium]